MKTFTEFLSESEVKVDKNTVMKEFKVGDEIHIVTMEGEKDYDGKEGIVKHIDDLGQIHGTWGRCALIYGKDDFYKVK